MYSEGSLSRTITNKILNSRSKSKHPMVVFSSYTCNVRPLLNDDSITVSSTWELTSVSRRYSQVDGINTSLSRINVPTC